MPICAACGEEVARSGFSKAQLKKDAPRCKKCTELPPAAAAEAGPSKDKETCYAEMEGRPADGLPNGRTVVITGLATQRELNGAVGHVVSYDATKERYGVEIRCQSKQRVALKRTNLYPVKSGADGHGTQEEVVIEQDAYERRRKAALASSLECPICFEGMQDDHGGRALACGHRVHRSCWDELLAAQQKVTSANEDPIARCPVCRAWQGGDYGDQPWYDEDSDALVRACLGFMFQSRNVEERGCDASADDEYAFIDRRFALAREAGQHEEARRVLNITLREISKVVGPKPKVGLRLPEEERKRWMNAFSTWLMVYVLPCYPERKDDPAGPGDPADQAWLPYLVRWINSGGIKVIFEDPRPGGDGWAGQDGR